MSVATGLAVEAEQSCLEHFDVRMYLGLTSLLSVFAVSRLLFLVFCSTRRRACRDTGPNSLKLRIRKKVMASWVSDFVRGGVH